MSLINTFIYILTASSSLVLGTFALAQNFKSAANKSFFLFTLVQFLWIVALYFAYFLSLQANPNLEISIIFFRLAYGFGILMIFMLATFFYFFPRITFPIPKSLRIIFLILAIVVFGITAFTPLVHESQYLVNGVYQDTDIFGKLYPYYNYLNFGLFLTSAILAFQKTINLQGIEKSKIIISAIGGWAFLLTTTLTNVLLPLMGIWKIGFLDIGILARISPVFTLFFLIPTFYAIHKYRFFNFSNASLNLLRKIITYALYLVTVIWVYIALGSLIEAGALRGILSASIAIMVFKLAENNIPRLVTGGFKNFKEKIAELKSKIYYTNTYDELQNLVEKYFLIELNFINAKIFLVRKKSNDLKFPIYEEGFFTNQLIKFNKEGLIKNEIEFKKMNSVIKNNLILEMDKLESDLCLPLFSEKNLIGFLILKQKSFEEAYSKETLRELLLAKKDLEIGLMNVLLKMNLQEENNLMKSIIDDKTKELKDRINQINELVQQQSDFIAVTAHELRTPLSIATFQLEDIINSKGSISKKKDELKLVEDSILSLKQLTEKLFAIQQYDLNKVNLSLTKAELSQYLKKVFQEFMPIMHEKNLNFTLKIQSKKKIFVKIDPLQIRQVLHNLLKNASKFTQEKGRILLKLTEKSGNAIICVDDDGEGIPDELKKSIFEKFRTKSSGAGIGLGLYLCKKIIELHKGKIWVEDNEAGGASFRISLKKVTK